MSGLDPIVLSGVSTVWLLSYLRKSVHVRDISAQSDVISAYSFLMLIIFCLCLLICLGSFLVSNVSVLIPFVPPPPPFPLLLFYLPSSSMYSIQHTPLYLFVAIISYFDLKFQFLHLQHSSCLWNFVFDYVWCSLFLSGFCQFPL